MKWSEAFRRSLRALGWVILAGVVCGILLAIGALLGAFSAFTQEGVRAGSIIVGWVFLLIGWVGLVFSLTAILLKVFADAVVDQLLKRLSRQMPPQPTPERKD